MADLSDVEEAVTSLVSLALYPDGVEAASLLDTTCRIYRGWPSASALNADLAVGYINVTISPDTSMGATTTRYTTKWHTEPVAAELLVATAGTTVTFSGQVRDGQMVGLLVDGKPYVYLPAATDSPPLVAATVGAMVALDQTVQTTGATISIPWASSVKARVVTHASAFTEVRRQERDVRVIFWCPSPNARDRAAAAVDMMMARQSFLALPDRSHARISYGGTVVFDQAQNAQLYRRDLVYRVEYPTIVTDQLPSMLFGALDLNAAEFVA